MKNYVPGHVGTPELRGRSLGRSLPLSLPRCFSLPRCCSVVLHLKLLEKDQDHGVPAPVAGMAVSWMEGIGRTGGYQKVQSFSLLRSRAVKVRPI